MTRVVAGLGFLLGSAVWAAPQRLDTKRIERLRCRLVDVADFEALFGPANGSSLRVEGGFSVKRLEFVNGNATFRRRAADREATLLLSGVEIDGVDLDLECRGKPVLERNADLAKLDPFDGFASVSLTALDLREQQGLLDRLPFDSETEWPAALPPTFDPPRLLELGKNPGLGLRSLQQRGMTGRGVSVAILDQPLLLAHEEYSERLVFYDASAVPDVEPQMHASPVASLAVGRTLGVAPGARLFYFAIPTWQVDARHYADALDKVLVLNARLPAKDRIRVVSVSFGGFETAKNAAAWKGALKRADVAGVLVVTCSGPVLLGTLNVAFEADPDRAESWRPTDWLSKTGEDGNRLFVPGGNRTIASHRGAHVYQLDREGGMSWSVPWLAGLAALAFQARPSLTPGQFVALVRSTATQTSFGRVANPRALVEAVGSGP